MAESHGLYYMRARYYDPEVGRFINKDPIGYLGGDLNLYGYVGNNVANYFDPLGLLVVSPEMVRGWQRVVDIWNAMISNSWLPNFAKEFLCTDLESELISAQVPFGGVTIKAGGKLVPRAILKIEKHHIKPKYLGGHPKGPISKIPKDYHQKITNEFRKEFPYGKPYPITDPAFQQEVEKAMQKIYKKYPLATP
jgi:RHS repeat-associated protein